MSNNWRPIPFFGSWSVSVASVTIEFWITTVLALMANVSVVTAVIITNKSKINSIQKELTEHKTNHRDDINRLHQRINGIK